jgi:NAD(P) transhydrogenase subunit alpha
MVESMRPGSVIVDLAAEQGGNCELTVAEQTVEHSDVTIIGYTDLTSRLSTHASQFFGNNLIHLLTDVMKDGDWNLDLEDEVVRHSLITHEGEVVWPPPRTVVTSPTESKPKAPAESTGVSLAADPTPAAVQGKPSQRAGTIGLILGAAAMLLVGLYAPDSFIPRFSVFILSCVVGWNVVWAVTHALHTPLMAVTNAISGIIIVGGILQVTGETNAGNILALIAIFLASMNVFGGFLVTHRMLNMFHK